MKIDFFFSNLIQKEIDFLYIFIYTIYLDMKNQNHEENFEIYM